MKRSKFAWRLGVFLLAAVFAGAQDWANLKRYRNENQNLGDPSPGEKRVVFMGDSITEGWKDLHPGFFSGKPYVNRGISGQTTPQMLVRFRADVLRLKPAAAVILAGTNDLAGNTGPATPETIMDNLESMAELAKANGIRVVLCSVLPVLDYPWRPGLGPAEKIVRLNGLIREYAGRNGLVYLDYFSPMADERKGLRKEFSEDGVHPNAAGYQVMEPLAEEAIRTALGRD